MSNLSQPEIVETIQVPAWRMPDEYKGKVWHPQWQRNKEQDLADIREKLSHLTENEDWFFVVAGAYDVDVFFKDKRQAVCFKLRHTI